MFASFPSTRNRNRIPNTVPVPKSPNEYGSDRFRFRFRLRNPGLNNVQLCFSVNLQGTRLFIHGFSNHAMLSLIHSSYLLVNGLTQVACILLIDEITKNLQNTCHSDLIIYKSYATYILSGSRGKWRISHHLSITIGVDLVLIFRKTWLHIV